MRNKARERVALADAIMVLFDYHMANGTSERAFGESVIDAIRKFNAGREVKDATVQPPADPLG